MRSTCILIPARYNSTRLPGKPLVSLNGVPMVKRVYDRCKESGFDTYVLTDSEEIYNLQGIDAILDDTPYRNGTERCAGALQKSKLLDKYDRVINVQGDMPDITRDIIKSVESQLSLYPVVTAYTDMDPKLQSDTNTVKLIKGNYLACWFSREVTYGYHHLGIYGYRDFKLNQYLDWGPSASESRENLEQLRWLEHDNMIGTVRVEFNGIEINTIQDVEKWHETR